jgi:hypothetical protein
MASIPLLSKPGTRSFSDYSMMTLISALIREEPKVNPYLKMDKGVWLWNRTDSNFICSPCFCRIMNISPKVVPDLDFWLTRIMPDDLVKFNDVLDGILHDSKPRKFIFQVNTPDCRLKSIQCLMESLTNPGDDTHYIIGVFCAISENAFFENQN